MGIIVVRNELPVIELAPLGVNYDLTVEEMLAGLQGNNPDITSAHFPKMTDKTGVVEESLYLIRPVPTGSRSDDEVEEIVTAAGYTFEEWPSLGPLKEHTDELWNAGIQYVVARGPNSRWQDPYGYRNVVAFRPLPGDRRFDLDGLGRDWRDAWFLCHKLPQPSDT